MPQNKTPDIQHLKTSSLIPYARNTRIHSEAQVSQIAASIREFGFTNPVLIKADKSIIAGHGRVLAAQALEIEKVPCLVLDYLSDAQAKALAIADNKIPLNSGWDADLLKLEIAELKDAGVDMSLLAFADGELETLFGGEKNITEEVNDQLANVSDHPQYLVVIQCLSETKQQELYDEFQERGIQCKLIT